MAGDEWLASGLSLAMQAQLEAARRSIPRLHRYELEARLDHALCAQANAQHAMRQALGRVIELEARLAAVERAQAQQRSPWRRLLQRLGWRG